MSTSLKSGCLAPESALRPRSTCVAKAAVFDSDRGMAKQSSRLPRVTSISSCRSATFA